MYTNKKQRKWWIKIKFTLLLNEAEIYPCVITCDNNSTFLSKECQEIFEIYNIINDIVPVGDHNSLNFARTLKTVLQ